MEPELTIRLRRLAMVWASKVESPQPRDAAEADMARRGIDRLGITRGRAIATTVIGRTQMRADLEHFACGVCAKIPDVLAPRLYGTIKNSVATCIRMREHMKA
jgi:hypothetical protein